VDNVDRVDVLDGREDLGSVKDSALFVERSELFNPVQELAIGGQVEHKIWSARNQESHSSILKNAYTNSRCPGTCKTTAHKTDAAVDAARSSPI